MGHRTRVKICGITRIEDALLTERLGADALGFVFVPASARNITFATAATISNQLAPFITRVGLFLEATQADVEAALGLMPNLLPQFHGRETPEECERYNVPYIKAIGLSAGMPSEAELSEYEHAQAFLYDSNEPGQLGGTGHTFDWQKLEAASGKPVVLAGGLKIDNVRKAIRLVKPNTVDVSTGVEHSKGIKDAQKLERFFEAVSDADASTH